MPAPQDTPTSTSPASPHATIPLAATSELLDSGRITVTLLDGVGVIRIAREDDAEAVRRVKAPYVEHTAYNFGYAAPSVTEVAADIRGTLERYPFLIAEVTDTHGTHVVGFAQAEPYRSREADQWNVELTIYLAEDARGRGMGTALYRALLGLLAAQHVRNAYACVTASNAASIAFHEHLGFREVGRFPATGYKLGSWHETVYLWKPLDEVGAPPKLFIPFAALRA